MRIPRNPFTRRRDRTPLEEILSEIDRAIRKRNYYSALIVALTVPEICTSLTLERASFVKEVHYITWIEKYLSLGQPGIGMSAKDCWQLRGGVVHRADFSGHPYSQFTRVILGVRRGNAVHATHIRRGDELVAYVCLHEFCKEMTKGALRWLESHRNDEIVLNNMQRLVRYRPEGTKSFLGFHKIKPAIF